MPDPASPPGAGFAPLEWDGLAAPAVAPLEPDELACLLAADDQPGDAPWTIGEHSRSGRNRIYTLEGPDGRRWIAKQALTFPGAEARFYREFGAALPFVPSPLLVDEAAELVVSPLLPGVRPATDPIRDVAPLAEALADLHALRGGPAREWTGSARQPFPALDPVDVLLWEDSSAAARALITRVQSSAILTRALERSGSPGGTPGFIHGDLKTDNILLAREGLWIVDWECAGRGPVEWDVAAVAASWLLDSCDRAVGFLQGAEWPGAGGAAGAGSADVATVLSSIRDLLERYVEAGGQEVDAGFLVSCIATWIIGRSWVQASFHPAGLPPAMEFRLLLAEDVAANPDRLEGRA